MIKQTKSVKVTRTTGVYNPACYNFKVHETPPSKKGGWEVWDAVRNVEQVKDVITAQPPGTVIIVRGPKSDPAFPYYIYRNEKLFRLRLSEQKEKGITWR